MPREVSGGGNCHELARNEPEVGKLQSVLGLPSSGGVRFPDTEIPSQWGPLPSSTSFLLPLCRGHPAASLLSPAAPPPASNPHLSHLSKARLWIGGLEPLPKAEGCGCTGDSAPRRGPCSSLNSRAHSGPDSLTVQGRHLGLHTVIRAQTTTLCRSECGGSSGSQWPIPML